MGTVTGKKTNIPFFYPVQSVISVKTNKCTFVQFSDSSYLTPVESFSQLDPYFDDANNKMADLELPLIKPKRTSWKKSIKSHEPPEL